MGLFMTPEQEAQKLLQKYHLTDLQKEDMEIVMQIADDISGNELLKKGTALTGRSEDLAKITYLSAIVRQNWIMINQLSRIEKLLKK